ncbi:MAG: YicC family protein [Planctomycetes bacterium]|nr:YicC family protein [Planctomycetota bacterium]
MTGYGSASRSGAGFEVTAEVTSVNNRYLKIFSRLPEALNAQQVDLERLVREAVARGSVTLGVRLRAPALEATWRINPDRVRAFRAQIADLPGVAEVRLADILALPGAVEQAEPEGRPRADLATAVAACVREACAALTAMREREGQALAADLLRRAGALEAKLAQVEAIAPEIAPLWRDRFAARMKTLLEGANVALEAADLAREAAQCADRCDISEEIVRLSHHLAALRALLAGGAPGSGGDAGRRLDFIGQEMLREANTIGSKSPDARVAALVVDMKVEIERIKEQAQNVE